MREFPFEKADEMLELSDYTSFINDFANGVNEKLSTVERDLYDLSQYILTRCEEGERIFGKKKKEIFEDLYSHPNFRYSRKTLYQYRQTAELLEQMPGEILGAENLPFTSIAEIANAKLPPEEKVELAKNLKPNQTGREIRQQVKKKQKEIRLRGIEPDNTPDEYIFQRGDFRELELELADGSVDMIFTDPPYGAEHLELWGALGKTAARVLKQGGFILTYSGQVYLPHVMASLSGNLEYYWIAAVLLGGGNRQIFSHNIVNQWKPILIYGKLPLKVQEWWLDLVKQRLDKTFHDWQQDADVARYFVRLFSPPNGLVLDPMCGSGSTAIACLHEKRRCISFDSNAEVIETAKRRFSLECSTLEK